MAKLSRVAAVVPAVGAVIVASALTGAAAYTVAQPDCVESGHYVQRGHQVELVHSCLDRDDLPEGVHLAPRMVGPAHGNQRRG